MRQVNEAGHNQPCRLCGSDDDAALIERVAEDAWESRRRGTLDDWPWAEASDDGSGPIGS